MSSKLSYPAFISWILCVGVTAGGAGCSSGSSAAAATGSGGSGGGGGGDDGGAATDGSDAQQPPANVWDWTGIIGTGQSLSVGAEAPGINAAVTDVHNNLKLSLNQVVVPPFDPTNTGLTMVPLIEPIRGFASTYPSAYPKNIYGETPHTAMADQITAMAQAGGAADYITVHTVVGESGQPMSVINKTATEVVSGATSMGRAYQATLFEVSAIARLAAAAGKTYGVGAIVITHGESDAGLSSYEDALHQLWSDYNADLAPLTGQTRKIPLFTSQQHSVPTGLGVTSASTLAQWKAGVDYPGDLVCTGPKYQYPYAPDNVHLTGAGYEMLGEKYAEVFYERVVQGHDWQPLQPMTVDRSGRVITVHMHVPAPPLAWSDTLPMPHQTALTEWAMGRGFEVRAGGAVVPIASVAIAGDDIQVTVATDLPATGVILAYAMNSDGTVMTGGTARWGQLRDSDAVVGAITGKAQPNYCVAFLLPVP
jgi:hypothetical protein